MNKSIKAFVLVMLLTSAAAAAQVGVGASSLFEKGRVRATITGGWGQAFNQDYFVLGAGMGYFLLRGLELGVDGEFWLGEDPQFQKVTPELRYIFRALGPIYPYVGTFYRRIFYNDFPDTDSFGGRVGGYVPVGDRVYVGAGAVFERQVDCDESIYDHCSTTYPEFTITFAF